MFWTKLVCKTNEQERDFTTALTKMDKFHVFSTDRYSNLAILANKYTKICLRNFEKHTQVHNV